MKDKKGVDYRYWDAVVFLGWLLEEEDKVPDCETVVSAAEEGKVKIVTSAITLAEVLHLGQGYPRIPTQDRETVKSFFRKEYIVVRNVNRFIAERSRDLIWDHGLRPKDAIHVATALIEKIPVLDTFDDQLIGLNMSLGNPPLKIEKPNYPYQTSMGFDS